MVSEFYKKGDNKKIDALITLIEELASEIGATIYQIEPRFTRTVYPDYNPPKITYQVDCLYIETLQESQRRLR